MKRIFFAVLMFVPAAYVFAAEPVEAPAPSQVVETEQVTTVTEVRTEKIAFVEKMTELPGLISAEGKLLEAIGIETLAGIVTPIIGSGSTIPSSASLKLGISSGCNCAKLKLFRIPADPKQKPVEISYDAIRGFSADNKTVKLSLEVQTDSRLHLKVETPANLEPGKLLEWMPAHEIVAAPAAPAAEEKKETPTPAVKPEEKIQTWEIADHLIDCQGVAPMKCLFIKKQEKDKPEAFYNSIAGFDYKEGFDYVIKVKETPVVNPSADGSSVAYALVEVVSQKPTAAESSTDLSKTEPSAK